MKLGKLGVWAQTNSLPSRETAAFAQRLEAWGYPALWVPEGVGRNVLTNAGWLLANTKTLIVASGIANIYGRDAVAMKAAQYDLNEQSGGRFLLGIGVSHAPMVTNMRGHHYGKPVSSMRAYLEAMEKAPYVSPQPAEKPLTVLAALGPKMMELSRDMADGAHPYLVTPAHTREAREILGPGKMLCVEHKILLTTDAAQARATGRASLALYLRLENYRASWKRMGFTDADLDSGGSDALIDAMFAWGDEAAIRATLQAHWDSGADHVCIQALIPDGEGKTIDEKALAAFAPAKH